MRLLPVFFLVLTCALWGLSFPLIKALHLEQSARVPETGSMFLAMWMLAARFTAGGLILLPVVMLMAGKPTRKEVRQGFVLALWGGSGLVLQADGLAHTAASTSAFLTQAYCVFLPLWACLRTRRKPQFRIVLATLAVVAGTAVLSGLRPDDLRLGRGEWETLLAAFLFTFQILTLEDPFYQGNRPLPVTMVMCLAIGIMAAPAAWLAAPTPAALWHTIASWPAVSIVLTLGLVCSVAAYLLMNTWQPKVPATEAGLIYTTEPVFTSLYVLFLPAWLAQWCGKPYANESWSATMWIGGGLILAANVLVQWPQRRPTPAESVEFPARH